MNMRTKTSRIVNIRYKVNGLHFDAAVDCDWQLHAYGFGEDTPREETPIELYCFDHEEWDIHMIYQQKRNDQSTRPYAINHTEVDWDNLLKETRKWVREMRKK